jgi:chlorite dismutase
MFLYCGCSLSRAIEQRTDKEPQLSDLRESGSLEQDADVVMFIHRPELYEKDTIKQNIAQIKIAKHRNGQLVPSSCVPQQPGKIRERRHSRGRLKPRNLTPIQKSPLHTLLFTTHHSRLTR